MLARSQSQSQSELQQLQDSVGSLLAAVPEIKINHGLPWYLDNGLLSSWDAFLHALELRFGPSSYENHRQALFKVRQTGSLQDYQLEFECLCNRVVGLSRDSILDCFLSRLRLNIQKELAILHPTSISQAIGLARLIDSKL
ncbi:UNVERIFIED_CONTAM: hypothetical protein Slati_2187700 [Sesamum latifolium]|uniref:Retrotransposon gag domain-containing protein n=1 Tax=Sesamum latifolium TaxID=2727402 RepID=A0AAW2WT87_9LAMI